MSSVRSPVVDPMAFTENKILSGTSLAVTRMLERNADCISAELQDANVPRPDSQEKTIVKDTCDAAITVRSNQQEDFAKPAILADELHIATEPVRYSTSKNSPPKRGEGSSSKVEGGKRSQGQEPLRSLS